MAPWLKDISPLYWAAVFFLLLALWVHEVRSLYLAALCVVIGFLQQVRNDTGKKPE